MDKPEWKGWPLAGGRILLQSEQGLGDTLQFARYIPFIRGRGGVPIIECQRPLVPLMASVEGVEEVIASGYRSPSDCHAPMMSLAAIFETLPTTVPNDVPYLLAFSDTAERWRIRLAQYADPALFRIGLTWAGNPHHRNDRNRSIPAEKLDALADLPGIAWFALQKNPEAPPRPCHLSRLPMISTTSPRLRPPY